MIMHIDMDAFFASIEQQAKTALRGRPLIVGARDNKYRTVVCAASYEAKAFGITSGMPSYQAFKLCPHAAFVPADGRRYARVSGEIFEILSREFSPDTRQTSIDEFDLDTTGLGRLFACTKTMAASIKKRIKETFGLTCSIGVAGTWPIAKLGSEIRKPDGFLEINASNLDSILNGLPVDKICGIGPALTQQLANLGIATCDRLKAMPEAILTRNFGLSQGRWLYGVLRCDITTKKSKIEADADEAPQKSISHSHTLPHETTKPEIIQRCLRVLAEMTARRLRRNHFLAHTVSVAISSRNDSFLKQKSFVEPTNDGLEIFLRAKAVLGQKNGKIQPIRGLGITLSGLVSGQHLPLFDDQKKREALLTTMDRINSRFGSWSVFPASVSGFKETR